MADDARSSSHTPAIGIVGAIAAIASIWWFAYRPRRRRAATGDGAERTEG